MGLLICGNKEIKQHTAIYLSVITQTQSVGKIINEVKNDKMGLLICSNKEIKQHTTIYLSV